MDPTRWDTGQVLDAGVLDRKVPDFGMPEDRERESIHVSYEDDREYIGEGTINVKEIVSKLDSGAVIDCPEYYGIPIAWKEGDSYRAVLLQYRRISERHTFATVDECAEWFADSALALAG